jgi:hypothetical protein
MTTRKSEVLWVVNVMSFICFSLLGATGLGIHEGLAVLFIGIVVVHLLLHWGYLKARLKKYGKGR